MATFRSLGLQPWLSSTLKTLNISTPTPVQANLIPPILAGQSVIGASETGTGKTAAFVLPILQHLSQDPFGIHSLIITPTRELAFQISQQVTALGSKIAVKTYVLVGGVQELAQMSALSKRPHVVVATPGRVALMVRKGYVDFSRIKFLVVDEADRMLDPAYAGDLKVVLDACTNEERQTLLFSATMTKSLEMLGDAIGEDAVRFDSKDNRFATVEQLDQRYCFMPHHLKDVYLVTFLKDIYPKKSVIIFVSRCETAELLVTQLKLLGMKKAAALHSDMKQIDRIDSLQKFKSSTVRALVATDVASRGLDIPACELVINYDVPRRVATYVHRVGRTARAGRSGTAISFVAASDVKLVHAIEEQIGKKLEEFTDVVEKTLMGNLGLVIKSRQLAKLRLIDNGFMEKSDDRRHDARERAKKRRRQQRNQERKKPRIESKEEPSS